MKEKDLYKELLELAAKLDIQVRLDDRCANSSSCLLNGKKIIILNSQSLIKEKIDFLIAELKKIETIDQIFCAPAIRELLSEPGSFGF